MLACTKRPYPTAVAAALALRRIRDASPRLREVGIYPCSACRAFHLTSHTAAARNRWTLAAFTVLGALACHALNPSAFGRAMTDLRRVRHLAD